MSCDLRISAVLLPFIISGCSHAAPPVPEAPATEPPPAPVARAEWLPPDPPPAAVTALLAAIDGHRMHAVVETLASFGTRHTLSSTTDPGRGIGAAREWIAAQFQAVPGLEVVMDRHTIQPDGRRIDRTVEVVNVVATLPGTLPAAAGRHYYVIGHYDSRASDPMDANGDAPGANDDASGVAVVLEAARVLATGRHDATLVFMATAGEEQGLIGADAHARAARERGLDIRAVLNHDIVGDPTGPSGVREAGRVRVFSSALDPSVVGPALERIEQLAATHDSPSRELARTVEWVGDWHELPVRAMLVFRRDRFLRGGDHTAFVRAGYPAIRFTEVEEEYDRQHQDVRIEGTRRYGDLPEYVDPEYLQGVARLSAATLAHLANAPSSPPRARIVTAALGNDTTLRWDPSPEPDVAGYEVVWRDTTSARWEHVRDVGPVHEITLPLSKDNVFVGIRAYDRDGYRSPIAFTDAAPE